MKLSRTAVISILVNAPQVAATFALAINSIWFDDYATRGIGRGVTYAAYTLLIMALCQTLNVVSLFIARRSPGKIKSLLRIDCWSLAAVLFFIWAGIHFEYRGVDGAALLR